MGLDRLPQVLVVVLLALLVGMQIGRLLTLWQLSAEKSDDGDDQSEDGNDEIADVEGMVF